MKYMSTWWEIRLADVNSKYTWGDTMWNMCRFELISGQMRWILCRYEVNCNVTWSALKSNVCLLKDIWGEIFLVNYQIGTCYFQPNSQLVRSKLKVWKRLVEVELKVTSDVLYIDLQIPLKGPMPVTILSQTLVQPVIVMLITLVRMNIYKSYLVFSAEDMEPYMQ